VLVLAHREIGMPDVLKDEYTDVLRSLRWFTKARLGGGAQGIVYRVIHARDTMLANPRSRALKVLTQPADDKALRRFYDEITALQKLKHPGLIPIVESSTLESPLHYYVMDYIEGLKPLAELMTEDRNPFYRMPLAAIDAYIELLHILDACH